MPRPANPASLIFGLLGLMLGGVALWNAFGVIDWNLLRVIAPLSLVAVGVLGLTLSRHRI